VDVSPSGRSLLDKDYLGAVLRRALKKAVLPHHRVYDLRHTYALYFAKMVMGLRPTLHHENRLSSPRADARTRR
jgi:hypothetical protein